MNKSTKQKHFMSWGILLLALVMICLELAANGQTAVASPDIDPNWMTPVTITDISNSPFGAIGPVVSSSPDGKTVMVVYNRGMTSTDGDNDPYFRRSLDNGKTWSAPAPIYTNVAKSRQVHLDYAANGIAHVAWQENTGLAYAREASKNSNSWLFQQLVGPISQPSPGVSSPFIVANGSSRVDIVWAEGNSTLVGDPDPRIYHIRSKNDGSSFSVVKKIVFNTNWAQQFPSMAVEDQTGVVHLVWQEPYDFFVQEKGSIVYSRGTELPNGTMSWTTPIKISVVGDAREPDITLVNNTLQVAYTDYRSTSEQYIRHTQCAANCTSAVSWQPTTNAISGQISGANGTDPFNLVADIEQWGGCTVTYFHGTVIGPTANENEIIWGVDSCSGWDESPRDQVTTDAVRSINPIIDVQNNWWFYMVYEQGATSIRQVYLQRTKPNILLPVVFK